MFAFVLSLAIAAIPAVVAGTVSGYSGWYAKLTKPFFTPPSWLFGPVWGFLYTLMGISAYMVWRVSSPGQLRRKAAFTYLGQLTLNTLWTPVFFGLQSVTGGLIIIWFLIPAIIANIMAFYQLDKKAGILLIPYLLWVLYAATLNTSIWYFNALGDLSVLHIPVATF